MNLRNDTPRKAAVRFLEILCESGYANKNLKGDMSIISGEILETILQEYTDTSYIRHIPKDKQIAYYKETAKWYDNIKFERVGKSETFRFVDKEADWESKDIYFSKNKMMITTGVLLIFSAFKSIELNGGSSIFYFYGSYRKYIDDKSQKVVRETRETRAEAKISLRKMMEKRKKE